MNLVMDILPVVGLPVGTVAALVLALVCLFLPLSENLRYLPALGLGAVAVCLGLAANADRRILAAALLLVMCVALIAEGRGKRK